MLDNDDNDDDDNEDDVVDGKGREKRKDRFKIKIAGIIVIIGRISAIDAMVIIPVNGKSRVVSGIIHVAQLKQEVMTSIKAQRCTQRCLNRICLSIYGDDVCTFG